MSGTPNSTVATLSCPTPDAIRAAAGTSPEAKAALSKLFPAVFVPKRLTTAEIQIQAEARTGGEFAGYGLFLTSKYTWTITRDAYGLLVLTAAEKS